MKDRKVIMQMVEDMTDNPLCSDSCGCREYYAEALFDEGYRKQSETAEKFAERLKEKCRELENKYSHLCKSKKECLMETCRYEGVLAVKRSIDEILKEITEG